MEPLASLAAANIALVGGHFVLSHSFRAPLVKALSEKGFLALYSIRPNLRFPPSFVLSAADHEAKPNAVNSRLRYTEVTVRAA